MHLSESTEPVYLSTKGPDEAEGSRPLLNIFSLNETTNPISSAYRRKELSYGECALEIPDDKYNRCVKVGLNKEAEMLQIKGLGSGAMQHARHFSTSFPLTTPSATVLVESPFFLAPTNGTSSGARLSQMQEDDDSAESWNFPLTRLPTELQLRVLWHCLVSSLPLLNAGIPEDERIRLVEDEVSGQHRINLGILRTCKAFHHEVESVDNMLVERMNNGSGYRGFSELILTGLPENDLGLFVLRAMSLLVHKGGKVGIGTGQEGRRYLIGSDQYCMDGLGEVLRLKSDRPKMKAVEPRIHWLLAENVPALIERAATDRCSKWLIGNLGLVSQEME
ncbi:MAG: hypothetical protein Q9192_000749 [Flavoplaca navasiana]